MVARISTDRQDIVRQINTQEKIIDDLYSTELQKKIAKNTLKQLEKRLDDSIMLTLLVPKF